MNLNQVKDFAERAHAGQFYHKEFGYGYHLQHVELIALRFGFTDEVTRKACWLHDVLEDTAFDQDDLRRAGVEDEVIAIVECVTDGPGSNRRERKSSMYPKCAANNKAVVVKLCDRIANVEECIKTKSKQFGMYFREMPEFEQKLRVPGQLDDMWTYLNSIIYSDAVLPKDV